MPAAAVIPAPIAYINVVVVKKLVVGFRQATAGPNCLGTGSVSACVVFAGSVSVILIGCRLTGQQFYFEKIRVLKAGAYLPEYSCME